MLTLRRRPERNGGGRGNAPRSAGATAVSIAVNVLAAVLLWQAVQNPLVMTRLFTREPLVEDMPRERIRYLITPPRPTPPATAPAVTAQPPGGGTTPRAGRTEGRESPNAVAESPRAPLVAPSQLPTTIPPPGNASAADSGAPASGPLASGRGPLKGIQPGYADPRLWVEAPVIEYAPKTAEERLDSAVVGSIMKYRDSVLANTSTPNRFERGDWTYRTKGGDRYGIDQQFIRLGKFSIPTALLALLPMNKMQGNPIENDRQARLAAMRTDIMMGAQAAMNEEEFRQAVKQIRARKEKERKAAEKAKKDAQKTISEP